MNTSFVLEIKDLIKSYDDFRLDIPSLKLKKGRCFGLVGENGAGKSTLIKLILGIVPVDKGEIVVLGKDDINEIRSDIGVAFESSSLSGYLCIDDVNQIYKHIFKERWNEKYFYELVLRFELPRQKKMIEFSQGMKAKISIVTLLAHNPKLIILDESTSNLDPVVRREINNLIVEYVHTANASLIYSSHLVNELEEYVDEIHLIARGRILISCTPKQLRSEYKIINNPSGVPDGAIVRLCTEGKISYLVKNCANNPNVEEVNIDLLMFYLSKGERV